jgi:hypothetical protein
MANQTRAVAARTGAMANPTAARFFPPITMSSPPAGYCVRQLECPSHQRRDCPFSLDVVSVYHAAVPPRILCSAAQKGGGLAVEFLKRPVPGIRTRP